MDSMLSTTAITWLAMAIRTATPLLFAALGGLICQKSGIFNFGLEGMMLAGAFFAYFGSLASGSPWIGLISALIAGGVLGWLLGFTSIKLGASQFMVGIGISILASGMTAYLFRILDVGKQGISSPTFGEIDIPVLSSLPVVGPVLFHHTFLVYVGLALVIGLAWFLNRTSIGLNLRSVGENPQVAETAGIDVFKYRYAATIASGMLAALGGAFLTLTQVNRFVEEISAGRGWIALAAIMLGKYNPWGVLGACLLFGAADSLQMQAQILKVNIPYQFLLMTPYILAILAMGGIVGKVRSPAAQGKSYLKN
jgi:general nucleoside transport system permease protein